MKKTLSIILVGALAVTSVIGVGAVIAKRSANDTLPSKPAFTQKATQTPTQSPTQTSTQKVAETQNATTAKPKNTNSNTKSSSTSTSQSNGQSDIVYHDKTDDSMVMPDLIGLWGNPDAPGCSVRIVNQSGNTIDFVIESRTENYSKIATAKVSASLETFYDENGVLSGSSAFEYSDSFDCSGIGYIVISGNTLYLTIEQDDNQVSNWSISNATGTYVRV